MNKLFILDCLPGRVYNPAFCSKYSSS